MTSSEIQVQQKSTRATKATALWEIAFQLAKLVEMAERQETAYNMEDGK